MKNTIRITLFIIVLVVLISTIFFFYVSTKYNKIANNIKQNYYENGKALSDIIKIALYNNIQIINLLQEYIYEEMLNDLKNQRYSFLIKNSPVLVYDTVAEGFYFSEVFRNDSFKVTIYNGKTIKSIAKSKAKYKHIERLTGAGKYVQKIGKLSSIEYIIIQDETGIISATQNIDSISSILTDTLAMFVLVENHDLLRKYTIKNKHVYEFLTPFDNGKLLLRIGFKSRQIDNAIEQSRILLITGIVFTAIFLIFIIFILMYYSRNIVLTNKLLNKEKEISGYFQLISDGVFVIDSDGKVISFNNTVLKILNVKNSDELEYIIKNNKLLKKLIFDSDDYLEIDFEYENKYLIISTKTINKENRKIITIKDLTEIERLKEINKLKEKQALLGELSFKVAHELKNPLNGISIVLQRILHFNDIDNEEKELLEDALQEVDRMNKRIIEFTKFAKPIEYKIEKVNIKNIIEESISQLKILSEDKNIQIECNLEDCYLLGDREHLIIAIKNVILNAIEASRDNDVIKVYTETQNQKCKLHIIDNGSGIKKEIRSKILNLYFTTKKNGSGIGLSSAYRIIKDLNGEMEIISEEGEGTEIIIEFPIEE